jgi:hypothetical protein
MSQSLSHLIGVCAALVLLGAAFATDAPAASRLSCARAINSACGRVEPKAGRLQACFEAHFDRLSGPCGERLSRGAAVARACEADARKFCGGVKRAAQIPGCMKRRLSEVGEPCKNALARVGVSVARKR